MKWWLIFVSVLVSSLTAQIFDPARLPSESLEVRLLDNSFLQ
ncbi:MAG: hypothetical protein AABZ60_11470 [Planctomycetota bacterium]